MRISESSVQQVILQDILKLDCSHFQYLIDALSYGAPVHGGIALGLDRYFRFFFSIFRGSTKISRRLCRLTCFLSGEQFYSNNFFIFFVELIDFYLVSLPFALMHLFPLEAYFFVFLELGPLSPGKFGGFSNALNSLSELFTSRELSKDYS